MHLQTGSGKTFTMGTGLDGNLDESTQGNKIPISNYLILVGLVPRAVNYLMETLQRQYGNLDCNGNNSKDESFFEIYTSFLEIYNEEIVDLLAPTESCGTRSGASKRKSGGFSIREDAKGEIYLTGIREEKIVNGDEIFTLLQKGSLSRTTKSTEMNMVSSRSHAIFTLLLRQRREFGAKVLASKLHFVDLAGSERLKRTQAKGDRVKESISINSGLLALGNVISALGDPHKRSTHIPYRNSKLTRLLQDSLGGNSQTLMIACASPSSDNFLESLNTLKYADRAKNIQNIVQINEEIGGNGAFEAAQLKKQIASLKQEILHLRTSRRSENSETNANDSTSSAASSVYAKSMNSRSAMDQAEMARLRVQNSELKRRVTQMSKEKATIEAERDAFKAAAGPNAVKSSSMKLIAELKGRIAELETSATFNSIGTSVAPVNSTIINNSNIQAQQAPQTPIWLRQANVLVSKARDEIRENLQTIRKIEFENTSVGANMNESSNAMDEDEPMTPSKSSHQNSHNQNLQLLLTPSKSLQFSSSLSSLSHSGGVLQLTHAQFSAAVATRCESLMNRVRSDLALKEDLIRQFEICQAEYSSMRRNYDEKLRLVQENLQQAQRERDLAIKKATSANPSASAPTTTSISNRRYEERIKSLGKELNVARASAAEAQRALQARSSSAESSMKSLRVQLEAMRIEKSKLLARLAEETNKLKSDCFAHDSELTELRQREYRATESARKLKKAYDFQKALLQKRIEQNHQARHKIRHLLLALKKQRSGGSIGFDESEISEFMMDTGSENNSTDDCTTGIEPENDSSQAREEEPASASSAEVTADTQTTSANLHSDDDEILLQLNEQTEAVLNEEITMMDIDNISEESIEEKLNSGNHQQQQANIVNFIESQTGEVPRSALRHSPLISRRRDVFAKLEENKKNPFK